MSYRFRLLASVALSAVAVSGAALAADDFSWAGAHVGADLALGIGATTFTDLTVPNTDSLGVDSVGGGINAGFDFEVSPGLVFGVEAGIDFFNSEASITQLTFIDNYEMRTIGAAYLGFRGGVEVAPRTLAYGRLAYAAIYSETSAVTEEKQEFLDGYHVAFGLETEVTDNVTLRLEGTYTQALEPLVINSDNYEYTPSHFGASAGVTYRFGTEGSGPREDMTALRSWTGGYVGVLAGVLGTTTVNGAREPDFAEGPVSAIVAEYGAYLGVNLQVGESWVVGIEGEYTRHDADYDFVRQDSQNFASTDHKGQVSGRLGFLANPDTLIYARAGYGLMHIVPDEAVAITGTEADYVQTVSGGLGIETLLNENALLRVEGLYNSSIDEYNFFDPTLNYNYAVKPTSVEARLGAAFMF